MEESSQRPLHTSFSSFSCTSLEVKANWGGGFDVLRGIPWHTSFPVQGVLGIRVPWTLTVELLSPVFLLPPQSLLTGEIMDGTRFWGLAQCLSWAVLQRGLWAASCSLFGCFFFFFKQRREGMISVWLGFFSVVFTNLWHWCSWCIHCHKELVTRKIFLEQCYSGTRSALADVSLQGCD